MNLSLENRVALVTGGGRGIGAGCSLAFAEAGADVAMTYRRDADTAKATAEQIEKLGRRAMIVRCDVSQEDQAKGAIAEVIGRMSKVDILVTSAGIASRGLSVRDTTTEEMRRVLDTHTMGAFWCCQAVIDSMREQGAGHIILISSTATLQHPPYGAPYNMAKAAVESMAKALAHEEGPNGIRVNVIAPGLIETEMGRRLVKARSGADIKNLGASSPFGRVGQVEDIGNLAAFLCTEAGSYISSQNIYVHGGGFTPPPRD